MKQKSQEVKTIKVNEKNCIIDTNTGELLEILTDESASGKERPWRKHKRENMTVRECYSALADRESNFEYWKHKAERLESCGKFLTFNVYDDISGQTMKVKRIGSCRVRLCPLCSWRRSLKIHSHMRKILDEMQKEGKYAYIMATFTVPNVTADELDETITRMMKSWDRLSRLARFKKAVKGWYRGLEVTHNVNPLSPSYDTYHPHFHCIFAVNKSYFKKSDYIKQAEWLEMWRRAYREESITQVDVRRVKPKKGKDPNDIIGAVCEVAKYTVKSADYIIPKDWDLSLDSVKTLDKALANRRLVAFGGVMRDLHKQLNLDDEIDGKLIEDGEEVHGEPIAEVTYFWHIGYQQYVLHRD